MDYGVVLLPELVTDVARGTVTPFMLPRPLCHEPPPSNDTIIKKTKRTNAYTDIKSNT